MTLEKKDYGASQTSIIEGTVKFRDGKKWKSRWCVMRKLSPVADCVHLQLYRDAKDRQKNGQTKASLSLQHFLALESGFTLDKESNTLAVLCKDVCPVLAFCSIETLLQWKARIGKALGSSEGSSESKVFPSLLTSSPPAAKLPKGPVRLHVSIRAARLCLTAGLPPKVVAAWNIADLRRYGLIEGRVCFEVGARGGRTEGAWTLLADRGDKLLECIVTAASSIHPASDNMRRQIRSNRDKRLTNSNNSSELDLDQMSEAESSIGVGDSASVMAIKINKRSSSNSCEGRQLGRCMSCMSRFGVNTNVCNTSFSNNSWNGDLSFETRVDNDRASLYSQSSGGTSDYSVPRSACRDLNLRKSSPVYPMPSPSICTCYSPRTKFFSGPYENYDVPKTPLPLIHENPPSFAIGPDANYDVPRNIKLCLKNKTIDCACLEDNTKINVSPFKSSVNGINTKTLIDTNELECSTEISPDYNKNIENISEESDDINSSIANLSETLKEFENYFDILKSAGFSQTEIDGLEDIPENEPISSVCDSENNNFKTNIISENDFKLGNVYTIDRHIRNRSTLTSKSKRKSSSAEFLKQAEEFFDITKCVSNKDISEQYKAICDNTKRDDLKVSTIKTMSIENEPKMSPEKTSKTEMTLLSKFKDSVKIRRSSSAPTKSMKNRDSSSSSDSGISTGSLKYKYDESNLPINKNKMIRRHMDSVYPISSKNSDLMQQISFQFHDMKSELGDVVCRKRGNISNDIRCVRSPSSCSSDIFDYIETSSISSMSSSDTCNRSTIRPRSGREYSTALSLQVSCEQCCQVPNNV